jgi:predicted house-cleaning noncanonical NTP pyrophosphatase (MazG superfamily)
MITYNKLVRDNIIDKIHASGWTEKHHIADAEEFERTLKKKLGEEAKELDEALGRENIMNELGDVIKITEELMKFYNITNTEIKELMEKKDEKLGGFDKRIILEEASEF